MFTCRSGNSINDDTLLYLFLQALVVQVLPFDGTAGSHEVLKRYFVDSNAVDLLKT